MWTSSRGILNLRFSSQISHLNATQHAPVGLEPNTGFNPADHSSSNGGGSGQSVEALAHRLEGHVGAG